MNRKLLAVVVSSAVAFPMAALAQNEEAKEEMMEVEAHSHPATIAHEHEMAGEDGEMMMAPGHAHEYQTHPAAEHGHDALHGHSVSVSGHIGRALVISDGDVAHSDLGASPSRFKLAASNDIGGGLTGGFTLEYGALGKVDSCDGVTCEKSADAVKQATAEGGQTGVPTLRQAHIFVSGGFGRLALGQQSPATDGIAYANFNGTAALGGVEVGCDYCSADFVTALSGSRAQGVKYTSPAIGSASFEVWSDSNDKWDSKVKLAGDTGGGRYQFQAGYGDDNGSERTVASGAVGIPNGAHANFAWGKTNAEDSNFLNLGVGYSTGATSVAANYYTSDVKGGGNAISVGVGHDLAANFTIFASYMHLQYDDDVNNTDDGDIATDNEGLFVIGTRLGF